MQDTIPIWRVYLERDSRPVGATERHFQDPHEALDWLGAQQGLRDPGAQMVAQRVWVDKGEWLEA